MGEKSIDPKESVEEYFRICEEAGVFPDEAGMILHLGLSRRQYKEHMEGRGPRGGKYRQALEWALLRRESILVRDLFSESKSATGRMFLARQPENGGLDEKTPPQTDPRAEVLFSGGDGSFD